MNHKIQKSRFQKEHEFSDDDRRYLLKWAGKKPIQEMAEDLNRDKISVQHCANKQGLSIRHKDNEWT